MNAHLQGFEVEHVALGHHQLAIEHAALGQLLQERGQELREVAIQRLGIATLQQHLVAITEDQRAESIPLRLENPARAGGQRRGSLGEHR